jgi:hypothetical protein
VAGGSIASRASEALEPVVLQLKWRHAFQLAGHYAALERCYYREAGLGVSLQELTNNQSPTDLLLAGSAQSADLQVAIRRAGLAEADFLRLPTNDDLRRLIRNEVDVFGARTTDQAQSIE